VNPGDLVKYHSPGYRLHGTLAVVVDIKWVFNQVSAPLVVADILVAGEIWRGIHVLNPANVGYSGVGVVLLRGDETA